MPAITIDKDLKYSHHQTMDMTSLTIPASNTTSQTGHFHTEIRHVIAITNPKSVPELIALVQTGS